jgi:hypothetical protein
MTQVGVYCYYALMNIVSHSKSSTRNLLNISFKKNPKRKIIKGVVIQLLFLRLFQRSFLTQREEEKEKKFLEGFSNSFTLALKY